MIFKVDLHTHSTASADGGISQEQYRHALNSDVLDCIAVTDHNRIDHALALQAELGDKIIVGEEIMTKVGEVIGLFLHKPILADLSLKETILLIKEQGGLVYIPHPFETVRKGLHPQYLEEQEDQIDIIEICNGRAFWQNRSQQAVVWARFNHKPGAASSDAHGVKGLGKAYTAVSAMPTRQNILELLRQATPMTERPSMRSLLYPKYHHLRKKLRRQR